MPSKKWNGRAFTSLSSLAGLLLLGLTGVILYLEPHGRVAYWSRWNLFGLEKDQWGNIHVYSGLLFLVAGGFHLYYNWKTLVKYLSGRVEATLRYKRELVWSGLVLVWILVSGIWSLPPLVYVSDLGESLKSSWVSSPELEPPFGHAELVSIKTFCKKQRIPLDAAMGELRKAGFSIEDSRDTLAEIAASRNTSGMGVYAVIQKLEPLPEAMAPGVAWTPDTVEEALAGTGLGQKRFGQVVKDFGLDLETARKRLKTIGVDAADDDRLKMLAEEHGTTPIRLMTVLLIHPE